MTRRSDKQMPRGQRRAIYVLSTLLWLSGIAWWLLDRWGATEGDFGTVKHPLQHPTLVLHGCLALAYLLLLGSLLTVHVRRGWSVRKQRLQAGVLFAVQALLVLSAAGLYYVGAEALRGWIAQLHLVAGLSLAALIPAHVVLARRRPARRASDRPPAPLRPATRVADARNVLH